nr:MarR family transcriptional regulator [uncultured Lachnoclostridium sp.]
MHNNRRNEIHRINYLTTEMESLYHLASLKLGITDSVSIVLYSIYDAGNECLLSEIYKKSGISKQTINSAIRGLEAEGILYLKQYNGRSKKVILTDKGKEYVQRTVARLYQAEMNAFDTWTEDEISTYIGLMEKYADCFRQQIEKL